MSRAATGSSGKPDGCRRIYPSQTSRMVMAFVHVLTHHPDNEDQTRYSTRWVLSKLLARRAGVHVDFHANLHFNDRRCFPGHLRTPLYAARLPPTSLPLRSDALPIPN